MIFQTVITQPLYNALIFLVDIMPGGDVGLAVIVLTIVVRLILWPLSKRSIKTQIAQRKLQPEIERLKEEYKDDKQAQAQKTMELYKEYGVNPFSGCFLLLLQLPIIIGVYRVFIEGVILRSDILYPFILFPEVTNTIFLGIFDLGEKSIFLALLAGASQFWQIHLTQTRIPNSGEVVVEKPKDSSPAMPDMASIMQKQMKYMMPVMVTIFAYIVPAAVALYWVTSNAVMIIQELIIRRQLETNSKE